MKTSQDQVQKKGSQSSFTKNHEIHFKAKHFITASRFNSCVVPSETSPCTNASKSKTSASQYRKGLKKRTEEFLSPTGEMWKYLAYSFLPFQLNYSSSLRPNMTEIHKANVQVLYVKYLYLNSRVSVLWASRKQGGGTLVPEASFK